MVKPLVSNLIHLFSPNSTRCHFRYHNGMKMKLAGIIYLQEISQDRVTGTVRKNMSLFKKLCGDGALQHVILATTKWSRLGNGTLGRQREAELSETFWKNMLSKGSSMTRFEGTQGSAKNIVRNILIKRSIDVSLPIQEDLVDLKKYLPQTNAGEMLYDDLQRLLNRLKGELMQLRDIDQADRDAKWRKEYDDMNDRIQSIVTEIKSRVPLTQKILGLVGLQRGISLRCVHSHRITMKFSDMSCL